MNGYASMGRGSAQPFTPTEIAALHALAGAGYPVPFTLLQRTRFSSLVRIPASHSLSPLATCH